jgi:hypothetical protein
MNVYKQRVLNVFCELPHRCKQKILLEHGAQDFLCKDVLLDSALC